MNDELGSKLIGYISDTNCACKLLQAGALEKRPQPPKLKERGRRVWTITWRASISCVSMLLLSVQLAHAQLLTTLYGHDTRIKCIAFSADGKLLASGGSDHIVMLWDTSTWALLSHWDAHTFGIASLAFSPDGKTLATTGGDWDRNTPIGVIKFWDSATRKEQAVLKTASPGIRILFSSDGKCFAIGNGFPDGLVRLYDAATLKELKTFPGSSQNVTVLAFSPDGKMLAAGGFGQAIEIWDVATGKEIARPVGHLQIVAALAFSPDGKTLASGCSYPRLNLWDVGSWKEPRTWMRPPSDSIRCLKFSPDGKTLAIAGGSKDAYLVDPAASKLQATLRGHRSNVELLDFSPDGKVLATASRDLTIKLWEVPPVDKK